ncbi:pyrroline-5-carboxylate reductase family protein [Brevundimonas sp. Root1279]|uniref:pyrroline-5-carboxylate reductase family protein n=1 Tax=Brevundimonas sp. Root1279 TaxID=1736443 RepID=UPI0006F545F2|nr:pyrroline-5-carboxylate reductase dimerization domain-containing protein [Brevundimonas sp. Root1279]KQW80856.1 pyrroline-5-carboxylate reductase [Brevundimonas sp. Root1279]
MTDTSKTGAVVLVGCGRLGSAIVEGWLATGAVDPRELIILTPSPKPVAEAARARGARVNPPLEALHDPAAVVLAVKPAAWRGAVEPLAEAIGRPKAVVSVMAGTPAAAIGAVLKSPVARVMPTTGVAQARGVAALWAADSGARETARGLFAPIADVVDLDAEEQLDAATATAGSAPAFIYAFVQAVARAGEAQGLPAEAAERLARGALGSAGAGLETGEGLEALIGRIASPGGTTRAGLDAMTASGDLERAAEAAVKAAVARAAQLRG